MERRPHDRAAIRRDRQAARDRADDAGPHGSADSRRSSAGSPQQQQQNGRTGAGARPARPAARRARALVEALELRVSGLAGLADAFRQTATAKDRTPARRALLAARRSASSRATSSGTTSSGQPTTLVLAARGVTGVTRARLELRLEPRLASTAGRWRDVCSASAAPRPAARPTASTARASSPSKALPGGPDALDRRARTRSRRPTDLAFEVDRRGLGRLQEVESR